MLLALPLTLNFFSPYVSLYGSTQGIVSGSLALFGVLFVVSFVLGRGFCGWVCPTGYFQDITMRITSRRVPRAHWVKYLVWGPWLMFIVYNFIRAGGVKSIQPLLLTEGGISVNEPTRFIIYYSVLVVVGVLAVAVGRHAFCHCGCWVAPFMVVGRSLRNLLRMPALQLKAHVDLCIDCLTCTKNCPMSIDVHANVRRGDMEHSDCTLCGTCVDNCPKQVIRYSFWRRKRMRDTSRTTG
jgi:polyferredoxin